MKRFTLCLLAVHVSLVPCYADVIPSTYDEKDPSDREAVVERLVDLGAEPARARQSIQHLMAEEVAYLAGDPERVQPVGSLYWYDWLAGGAFLGGILILALYTNNEYQKERDSH